jgi:hypothetical protein
MIKPKYRTSTVAGIVKRWYEEGCLLDWEGLPILADALEDAGYSDQYLLTDLRNRDLGSYHMGQITDVLIDPDLGLNDGDWGNVFAYSGEPGSADGEANIDAVPPGAEVALTPFTRWDVEEVLGKDEGENDGKNWIIYGRLKDGRYFFLTAGCDYTGWG